MKHFMRTGCILLLAFTSCQKEKNNASTKSLVASQLESVYTFDTTRVNGVMLSARLYAYYPDGLLKTMTHWFGTNGYRDNYHFYYDTLGRIDSAQEVPPSQTGAPRRQFKYKYEWTGRLSAIHRVPQPRTAADTLHIVYEPKIPGWESFPWLQTGSGNPRRNHYYFASQNGQTDSIYAGTFPVFTNTYVFTNTTIPNPEYPVCLATRLSDLQFINWANYAPLPVTASGATIYSALRYGGTGEKQIEFQYDVVLDEQGRVSEVYYLTNGQRRRASAYFYRN
ncbi:hypothetical protein MKQ68_19210 [Chitinophaga horti]|uniref:YD repeat-containing protein n=1 Tax=Chitinophaga horti TaxID=2920382 RepID=A0ABY6IY70_9BACT|nr:hypothetical protein [Chitinophaga horti]UYQ92218.1 hypothetical protein MKQ68_19210 [Chitinophaga horti]